MIINPYAFGGGGGGGSDPYFANVVSLLHFDGTNGDFSSGNVVDQIVARTWTTAGGSSAAGVLTSAQKVFGPTSILYASGVGAKTTCPDHTDWTFGTGDFTLEGRVRFTVLTANSVVLAKPNGSNYSPYMFFLTGAGAFLLYMSSTGSSWDIASGQSFGTVATDTWYGWALSRVGNDFYLFLDGTQTATFNSSASLLNTADPVILGGLSASNFSDCYQDEFRATKGVGRYTASYTPAVAAFPDS